MTRIERPPFDSGIFKTESQAGYVDKDSKKRQSSSLLNFSSDHPWFLKLSKLFSAHNSE